MSIAHIPFYPSDWLAGTRGMTSHETGVYITLIAKMYEMAGPIERDDQRLARLCGCQVGHFRKALSHLIDEGNITENDGQLFNEKAKVVLESVMRLSDSARQAAQARWARKPNKNNGSRNASESEPHMPIECQPKPKPKKEEEPKGSSKKKRGNRLPDDWVLPKDWGEWALGEGYPEQVVRLEADKFRDYWIGVSGQKGVKVNWKATWRNWVRNSSGPKAINGGGHGQRSDKGEERMRAFIAGARGTP